MRVNPDLPTQLEQIITKALEKDREMRYQSAAELRTDLKRLKRDADSGRSALLGVVREVHARRRWIWAAGVLGLVLLIGGSVWLRLGRSKPEMPAPPLRIFPLTSNRGGRYYPLSRLTASKWPMIGTAEKAAISVFT